MSANESRLTESSSPRSLRRRVRPVLRGTIPIAALALLFACGGGGSGTSGDSNGTSGTTSNNNSTGTSGTTSNNNSTGTSGTTSNNNSTGTGGTTSNSTGTGTGGSTSNSTSTSTSSTGGTTGVNDAGETADGAPTCTNTNTSAINIDSSGWVCNNKWDIQGAWYCYADGFDGDSSSCTGTGDVPYNATSKAMCISGTTAATSNTSAFGAGLGLVLNAPAQGSTAKDAFNAPAQNIIGFAITVTGTTGGSVLDINFPVTPQLTTTGENAAVTVPGPNGGTSMTYNVLLADAIVSDNTTAPVPKINPADLTDVQVAIPGADGIAHAYNYCITSIVPITTAPAAPGSLATYGASFTEGKQIVLESLGPYGVQNDPFNVGGDNVAMTVSYGGGQVGFTAAPTFSGGSVGAFPSIISGWINGGNLVSQAEGGYAGNKTISALTSVTSSWSWTSGGGSQWDAAYDTWLAQNADPITPGFELMVWLGHAGVSPIGGETNAVTIAGAPGTWTFSTGTNGTNQPVISYVSSTNMTSVTNFNLLPFFQDAATNGRLSGLSTSTTLLSVQAGFELYDQGTWTTNSYSISIQ